MRTERFKGALLSTLVIASLMSPLLYISAQYLRGEKENYEPVEDFL